MLLVSLLADAPRAFGVVLASFVRIASVRFPLLFFCFPAFRPCHFCSCDVSFLDSGFCPFLPSQLVLATCPCFPSRASFLAVEPFSVPCFSCPRRVLFWCFCVVCRLASCRRGPRVRPWRRAEVRVGHRRGCGCRSRDHARAAPLQGDQLRRFPVRAAGQPPLSGDGLGRGFGRPALGRSGGAVVPEHLGRAPGETSMTPCGLGWRVAGCGLRVLDGPAKFS